MRSRVTSARAGVALAAFTLTAGGLVTGCSGAEPAPVTVTDLDTAPLHEGFHCAEASADVHACAALEAFDHGTPISAWPAIGEEQRFIGVEHCVEPTSTAGVSSYEVVYLRRDPVGSRPLPYLAAFASMQLGATAPETDRAAMAALARGEAARSALTPEALETYWPVSMASIFRPLVAAGRSTADDPPIWYLRASGDRLLLVSASIQGGCASELHRVR